MNTTKFLSNHSIQRETFAKNIRGVRAALFSIGVCWTDDVQGLFNVDVPFRVVLYTRKTNIDFKNPMVKECNGLVYEYKFNDNHSGWKLLAMPQYAFCSNKISMKKLDDLSSAGYYDVYEVLDATILTLYHFKGEWRASSTKGYDIGDTEIVSGLTFMEAVNELISAKYKSFRFENLNTNYSYTIALRHYNYHIFDEAKHMVNRGGRPNNLMNSYIMIMCVADTKSCHYVSKIVRGLPHQVPMTFKSNKDESGENTKSINMLTSYARSAYAKYAKAHQLQTFKYKPLYGYILRAKNDAVPSEYTTIYIESELFRSIKVGLYKDNTLLRSMNHDELVVRLAMNSERYEQFTTMFQQFAPQFQRLELAIAIVAMETVRRICDGFNKLVVEEVEDDPKKHAVPPIVASLISELVQNFVAERDISLGLIKDAMFSKKYVHYLHQILE